MDPIVDHEQSASQSHQKTVSIRCTGVNKIYNDVKAVDSVDLEIRKGECFGLLGPNGAGKTTMVEMMVGLTTPDDGQIQIFQVEGNHGKDLSVRQHLGIQLQESHFEDKLTVEETIRLYASFYKQSYKVDDMLRMVNLENKSGAPAGTLSSGQKQRLSLACTLIGDPRILFLDEPSTGLDPRSRLNIWQLIESFHARERTIILTTHYMEEAERLCDRIGIMDTGKIIASDSPQALIRAFGGKQIVELTLDPKPEETLFRAVSGIIFVHSTGHDYYISVDRIGQTLPKILETLNRAGVTTQSLKTRQASLGDVFLHLTGRPFRNGR